MTLLIFFFLNQMASTEIAVMMQGQTARLWVLTPLLCSSTGRRKRLTEKCCWMLTLKG